MANIPVARRYARGLLEAAGPEADVILGQLEAVVAFLAEQPVVQAALSNPAAPRAQRMAGVDALIKAVPEMHRVLGNLFKLLTDRSRFDVLPAIARQYREAVDVQLGRVRGKVVSAVKLGDAQVQAVQKSLEAMTQRKVMLDASVDQGLLGGVVTQVGSRVFDGSLRTQLRELDKTLRG